jgi:hypothetical protein
MKQQALSIDEKKEALQRVIESRQFRKAARLREFLRFVGSNALNGQTEEVHEADIGCAVYGRRSDYSPAEDSIVRVEARNLRKKLAAYYQSEGAADPVQITVPKGTYRPTFDLREADSEALERNSANHSKVGRMAVVLAVALLASLAGNLWMASSRRSTPAGLARRVSAPAAGHLLWSLLFAPGRETYIVVADSPYTLVQDLAQRSFTLQDYQRAGFPPADAFKGLGKPVQTLAHEIFWHQYTSLTDTMLAARIMQLPEVAQASASIRFARNLHTRDFKGRNVVLLGSARSNPWCELFEPQLNFRLEYDYTSRRPHIRNRAPRKGESGIYVAQRGADGSDEIYAVISLIRNLTNDGYVLMIAGTRMEGTEAAGEMLLNQALASDMIRNLGLESGGRFRSFEILVKSSRMEGTFTRAVVVAHRILGGV